MVVYELIYHIIFLFRPKSEKVDGGEWCVHLRRICPRRSLFSGQGTCVPQETSATYIIVVVFAEFLNLRGVGI